MRRRGGDEDVQRSGRCAANFYKQYAIDNLDSDDAKKYGDVGSRSENDNSKRANAFSSKTFVSSLQLILDKLSHNVLNAIYSVWGLLVVTFAWVAQLLASWREGNSEDARARHLDELLACVDCGKAFSPWTRWRTPCACCQNMFCGQCLSLRHKLHDGKDRGGHLRRVCSYCFFQLCARHCSAKCCDGLRISELRRFLSRKGLFGGSSTKGALDKSDLVRSVHAWATDLAAAETSELFGSDSGGSWA